MGRPREFDEQGALAAAAEVFRQQGYAATSIDHLVRATGVHRGSLYGTFGSKHGLFIRVLDTAAAPGTDPEHRLDLVLVALLELAPTDTQVRQRIQSLLERNGISERQMGLRLLARGGLRPERTSHDQ
jgi:TetR/AcrR family transcriptional regulator, transcriptional repressor for nem operon